MSNSLTWKLACPLSQGLKGTAIAAQMHKVTNRNNKEVERIVFVWIDQNSTRGSCWLCICKIGRK